MTVRSATLIISTAVLALSAVTATGLADAAPSAPRTAAARPWLAADQPPATRARQLLRQMTLPEKVDLMTGNQGEAPYAYYNAPIVRLGIPALKMADASSGVAPRGWSLRDTGEDATALPSMQALGATWSDATVAKFAGVVAAEVLQTGQNVLLGPDVDIQREPWFGRINESESEDPILNARVASTYVKEVQSRGVIATLKHYTAYNQETDRNIGQNSVVDRRTLREVYTLAFEAVIKQADLGAVMCSFNKINGDYSCDNAATLRNVLKGRLSFTGFVLSDFGALHDTLSGLRAGTDMETGTQTVYDGALLAAVRNGTASLALVDQACLRILRTMFRLGIFDRPSTPSPIPVAAHDRVALTTEQQAITLLKNDAHTLPLTRATKSVALIGADADVLAVPSGSPWVSPTTSTTTLQGIRARAAAAGARVTWVPGNDPVNAASMLERRTMTAVPSSVLSPPSGTGHGLRARYWDNTSFQGDPATTRTEPQVNYDVGFLTTFGQWAGKTSQVPQPPVASPTAQQSVVYEGTITAPTTGAYQLGLSGYGDITLSVDGRRLVTATGTDGVKTEGTTPTLNLTAGVPHVLRISYRANHPLNGLEPGALLLQWKTPSATYSPAIRAAAAAAARSDVAVVYVRTYEGEQRDRVALKLPQSAAALIGAVRAKNAHTVVVLANSGPVTMPWLSRVPAVVQTYFGGQEQGRALAQVLWGDVNPSGKLPITYPRSDATVPAGVTNPWAGAGDLDVPYRDGIDVGYKAYDVQHITPLFPFGYGLSYTSFRRSGLTVERPVGGPVRVRFTVTNTGNRAGADVSQVYLKLPASTGEPPRRLVGYARTTLAAGASRTVTVLIRPGDGTHPLGYFDVARTAWRTAAGTYRVYVGANERNTPLSATFAQS